MPEARDVVVRAGQNFVQPGFVAPQLFPGRDELAVALASLRVNPARRQSVQPRVGGGDRGVSLVRGHALGEHEVVGQEAPQDVGPHPIAVTGIGD